MIYKNEKTKKFLETFSLDLPIIQGGMVWVSGANLAAACARNGIIGTIGAGSMNPELLSYHLKKVKKLLCDLSEEKKKKAWSRIAVNFPLIYSKLDEQLKVALEENVEIFITSAGSPNIITSALKKESKWVMHVVSSPSQAKKCEDAGVDFIIAEGFEAGGHNGKEELTTMVLVPQIVDLVKIPVIAAGGIGDARGLKAALELGATGIQMGTRFLLTEESSAHPDLKKLLLGAKPGDTILTLKKHIPVRLYKNKFCQDILNLESQGATREECAELLGKGRAKLGLLEGDLTEGEIEVGQVVGANFIKSIPRVEELINNIKTLL